MAPRFALAVAVAVAAPAVAQLSGVGSDFFVEDDLGFYGPLNDDELGHAFATGDFNGDGADDLATGVPYDDNANGDYDDGGIVVIRYGAPGTGLVGGISWDVLSQFNGGSPNPVEANDQLGWALAAGDFDGDGYDDLAVGVPGDPPKNFGGAVQIHYGSAAGLDLGGSQRFHQDTPGIADSSDDFDEFGYALAAGDFDNDGFDDLAIGVPFEDGVSVGFSVDDAGCVHTLFGSSLGLSASRSQYFDQDTPGMNDSIEEHEDFGRALAAGDFNGDGRDDLAIGVPWEGAGGAVHLLYGSAPGLTVTGNVLWSQDSPGVADSGEGDDDFGWSLAAGDFDHDGFDDLAVGVPFEDVDSAAGEVENAGAVQIFRGGVDGMAPTSFWTQERADVPAVAAAGNFFGYALAAGDFSHDGAVDVAVGIPGQNVGHGNSEGVVVILHGHPGGDLTAVSNEVWRQGFDGLPGTGEQGDELGSALATGDFDANGFSDLAIGAPRESTVAFGNGAEWAIYGTWPPLPFADGFETGNAGRWSSKYPCGGPCS